MNPERRNSGVSRESFGSEIRRLGSAIELRAPEISPVGVGAANIVGWRAGAATAGFAVLGLFAGAAAAAGAALGVQQSVCATTELPELAVFSISPNSTAFRIKNIVPSPSMELETR